MASISKILAMDADDNNRWQNCIVTDKTEITGVSGTYGPPQNITPAHGTGTFNVPYFTVNSYGKITAIENKTVTLPSDNNTDVKIRLFYTSSGEGPYSSLLSQAGQTTTTTNTTFFSNDLQYTPQTGSQTYTQIFKVNKTIQGKVTLDISRRSQSGIGLTDPPAGITHTIATSSMVTGKPLSYDGHIIYVGSSSLYIKNSNTPIYMIYPATSSVNYAIYNETHKPTAQNIVANTTLSVDTMFDKVNAPLTLSGSTVSHVLSNPTTTTESVTTTTTYPYKIDFAFPVYNEYGHVTQMKNREYLLDTTNVITGVARDCTSANLSIQGYFGYTGDGYSSTANSPIYMESKPVSITTGTSGTTNNGITVYTGSASVTFENSFSRIPCIICTWSGSYTNQRWIKVINASTTGFTVYGSCSEASVTRSIEWFAIGPKNHV